MNGDWRERAACVGTDLRIFSPEGRGPEGGANPVAEAICNRCPVRTECLEDELATGSLVQYGWRGGKSPEERARIIRKRKRTRGRAA